MNSIVGSAALPGGTAAPGRPRLAWVLTLPAAILLSGSLYWLLARRPWRRET